MSTYFTLFFNKLSALLLQPLYYKQLSLALGLMVAAYLLSLPLKRLLKHQSAQHESGLRRRLSRMGVRYLRPIFTPMMMMMMLSFGVGISQEVLGNAVLVQGITHLVLVWMLLRIITFFSENKFVPALVALFLLPIVVLDMLGIYASTVKYLDSYAFTVGSVKFSLYTILKGLLVLTIVFWIAGAVSHSGKRSIHQLRVQANTRELLAKFLDFFVYIIVFLIGLNVFGVDLTTLAVVGGAVGVGIGFGLQKITSNFISGIILLFEQSIKVGDLIELQDGTYGWMRQSNARYTLIETLDKRQIMIPNEDFITGRVINLSNSRTPYKVEVNISVPHSADLEKVRDLLLEAAREWPNCSSNPAPICFLRDFGGSAVTLQLLLWIDDITIGAAKARSEVMFIIWRKFKEQHIEIPLPQREVHVHMPGMPAAG